jgi:hypothetical protein
MEVRKSRSGQNDYHRQHRDNIARAGLKHTVKIQKLQFLKY